MSLRWILPTVALALPALAQDAVEDAAPAVPVAVPSEKPVVPAPVPDAPAATAPASAPNEAAPNEASSKSTATTEPASAEASAPADPAAEAPVAAPAPRRARATASSPQPPAPVVDAKPSPGPSSLPAPVAGAASPLKQAAGGGHGHGHGADPGLPVGDETPQQTVTRIARVAFEKLLAGDANFITRGAAFPFYLDGRRFDDREPLFRELLQQLRARRTDLLSVDAIEVLTPEQMEKQHGKPPARLASLPWRAPNTWLAVGNLSGVPVVAIFQQQPRSGWKLIALTD